MLQKKSISGTLFLWLGLVLVLSGCYTKQNADEAQEPQETTSPPSGPQVRGPVSTTQNSTPSLVNVDVYLEISNGMKGFMPASVAGKEATAFQSRLNKLISEVQDGRYVDQKAFYLAKEDAKGKPVLDSVSYSTMKSYIVSGIQDDVRGTPLPDMLRAALQQSIDHGSVSVIISDFIHGPSDQGQFLSLDSDIRSALREAERQGLVVAVLGDVSAFHGTYHPAVKKPEVRRTLKGEQIPFYTWVIGKQPEVQVVINKVFRDLPKQQAYFGFEYNAIPYSALLKTGSFKPAGIVYCSSRNADPCTAVNLQPQAKEPVEFTVGLDLSALPASLQRMDFLKQHLKVLGNGCRASLANLTLADEGIKATPELSGYTHFVRVRVPQLTANTGSVYIQLPHVYPAWIKSWSTENDNNPIAEPGRTYQLTKIMDGVQALYRDQSDNIFNVTVQFNKAD
ncbi:hypothetical protein H9Q13_04295 [Pontibacter sp. JH31]|uniref:VWA domain-containing protein n=1 Tax=Pontibacter aquaedesilientis TaxID=2766980 RepID=A0ABR7XDL1_9BACT|nr:hypothetical protein [Pontibacter aquaedesilientis]MBD1396374.1 hypothetical protein [Pontibacter aquaedesilientis]